MRGERRPAERHAGSLSRSARPYGTNNALARSSRSAIVAPPGAIEHREIRQIAMKMDDEINAAETGSPDSVGNKDQSRPSSENWRTAWQDAESNDPDFG